MREPIPAADDRGHAAAEPTPAALHPTPAPDIALAEALFLRLAEATAEPDGRGVRRDSYGAGERLAHEIVAEAGGGLGLRVWRDAALNLYLDLPGRDPAAPVRMIGSHLDSVMQGGNFDGAAGVLAGLAIQAGLIRAGSVPPATIRTAAFRAEEGVWFDSSYPGSRLALGLFDRDELDTVRRSDTGRTMAEHMAEEGADLAALGRGRALIDPGAIGCFLEIHIEQGPVLEAEGLPIAVVPAVFGCARFTHARCLGAYGHSGGTPLGLRRDAVLATAEFVAGLNADWEASGDDVRLTVGVLATDPAVAAGSKVAGETRFILDIRGLTNAAMERWCEHARALAAEIEARRDVAFDLGAPTWSEPATMDGALVRRLAAAARRQRVPERLMASGPGHDAVVLAGAGVPTAMLFVRNQNGSHNPDEAMAIGDFAAAVRVAAEVLTDRELAG